MNFLKSRAHDTSGQGLSEYIILLMLVSVVCIGVTQTLGNVIKSKIKQARAEISSKVTFRNDSSEDSE